MLVPERKQEQQKQKTTDPSFLPSPPAPPPDSSSPNVLGGYYVSFAFAFASCSRPSQQPPFPSFQSASNSPSRDKGKAAIVVWMDGWIIGCMDVCMSERVGWRMSEYI